MSAHQPFTHRAVDVVGWTTLAEEIAAGYLEVVKQSEDHKEGPRSFLEKRKPQWKAR